LKVLVTGAAGMLGRDVMRVGEEAGHEMTGLARVDLDITDRDAVAAALADLRPAAVVNCAAWTDVDGAEDHPQEALAVNGPGAGNVAAAAAHVMASVIHPSTDYVFDGTRAEGYVESDEVGPLSSYGRSKLEGERQVAAANEHHFIVRSSWLFGVAGRNFVDTMLRLSEDMEQVVVVRDQIGCPTYTGHLAEGLVRLLDSEFYGIHHMAGSGRCSWYEFAVEIFRQAGSSCQVMSSTSDMLDRKAPRPPFSVLVSEREHPIELPPWEEGLAAYLAERAQVTAR
jgi:dTDP-4-dehydrorhamnose reductase